MLMKLYNEGREGHSTESRVEKKTVWEVEEEDEVKFRIHCLLQK